MEGSQLLDLYRLMYRMRRFEEAAKQSYTERKIGGFCHLYIGQEAVGAGVISALEEKDNIIAAYRVHAQYLAAGGTAREAMAELYGKETGCCKGRGGSMHFISKEHNFYGGHGIVGAHIPVASGLAFASKYRNDKSVTVCFFGEGATSIGPFHEALCLATLWQLPVVFIIENNGYAMGTPQSRQMVVDDVSVRALGYPMARKTIEGFDVVECYNQAKDSIDQAREESRPSLLEFKTYRYQGHSMADPAKYRTKDEVKFYKQNKDPLGLAKNRILTDHPEFETNIEIIHKEIEDEIADAVQFAEESPEPDTSTLTDYTYI